VCDLNEFNELVFIVVRKDIWFLQKNKTLFGASAYTKMRPSPKIR